MIQDFDLHIHTTNSDGELSTYEILNLLKENNIKYFSITDHDSIESINDLKNIALADMDYLKGVEISSILDDIYKMHILGYNFDENNQSLKDLCNKLKNNRSKRFLEIVEYVKEKYNLTFNKQDIQNIINNILIPGRPHLASLMLKYGYVSSVPEAFDKYLKGIKTKTSHREDAKVVIDTIHNAGGVAIWAHPKKVEKKYDIDLEKLIPRLIEIGLDGIEICNSLHSLEDYEKYLKVARKYNLITSGGSDYHGNTVKPKVKLGVVFKESYDYKVDLDNISIIEKR